MDTAYSSLPDTSDLRHFGPYSPKHVNSNKKYILKIGLKCLVLLGPKCLKSEVSDYCTPCIGVT